MKNRLSSPSSIVNGVGYFTQGLQLLTHKQLRLFLIIPVLINTLVFFGVTALFFQQFDYLLATLTSWLPSWLEILAWIVAIVAGILVVIIYGYSFSAITNIFAAPFYGVLAEKTEAIITGQTIPSEPWSQLIPRTLGRELRKLWYFIWRSLLVLLLSFIPVVGPIIVLIWGAWSMAIQYSDYPADNHQTPFPHLRVLLRRQFWSTMGFGGAVILGMMIPIVNIIVMPAAVIGGTVFWVREMRLNNK